MIIKQVEIKAALAVRKLRKSKLESGIPFMINMPSLPKYHLLYEFPDGRMKEYVLDRRLNDFRIIRELMPKEIVKLKRKYKLE